MGAGTLGSYTKVSGLVLERDGESPWPAQRSLLIDLACPNTRLPPLLSCAYPFFFLFHAAVYDPVVVSRRGDAFLLVGRDGRPPTRTLGCGWWAAILATAGKGGRAPWWAVLAAFLGRKTPVSSSAILEHLGTYLSPR